MLSTLRCAVKSENVGPGFSAGVSRVDIGAHMTRCEGILQPKRGYISSAEEDDAIVAPHGPDGGWLFG